MHSGTNSPIRGVLSEASGAPLSETPSPLTVISPEFVTRVSRNLALVAQRKKVPLDDRQITHLICVCLKHLLCDLLGGVSGLLLVVFLI